MWAGPAEGFFAISGILVGYIYGPRLARSFKKAAKGLWKRAFLLYALSIVFTLVFTAIAVAANNSALPPVWERGGESFLLNILLARYSYGWTDFLPRYAVFMAIAPFLLWLIVKGKAWIVAALSIVIWMLFHKTALFLPFSSWEIIFIPAMIVGYYLPSIRGWGATLPARVQQTSLRTLWVIAGTSFAASSLLFVALPMFGLANPLVGTAAALFDKETVGIGRLLLGIVWFWALYTITRRYERPIDRVTRGTLQTIGAKSLYTYCIHGVIVFIVTLLITPPTVASIAQSTLFAAMILCVIYVCVISPALARWLDYEYHKYQLGRLLRYNSKYEST